MKHMLYLAGFLLLVGTACDNKEEFGRFEDLSSEAQAYLGMQSGVQQAGRSAESLALGRSFTGMFTNLGGRIAEDELPNDGDDPWYWESCATITETTNEDGTYTMIYDYGDGCEEGYGDYSYFMHGKFTMTYSYNFTQTETSYSDEYFYDVTYENYGGSYAYDGYSSEWNMDGESTYEGSSAYNWETMEYSGEYAHSSDMDYSYDDQLYSYSSVGMSNYNEQRSITPIGINNFSYGDYFYNTEVIKPLVFKYSCNEESNGQADSLMYMFTYVSGKEEIKYSSEEGTGSFVIDYGNGECDNIIYIIEDGKRVKVDLGEYWADGIVTMAGGK